MVMALDAVTHWECPLPLMDFEELLQMEIVARC